MAGTQRPAARYSLRFADEPTLLPYTFGELAEAHAAAAEFARTRNRCLEILREDGSLAMTVYSELRRDDAPTPRAIALAEALMTSPAPSLRHVPKLVELLPDREPLYGCQLCSRRGTLDQLMGEECRRRSGVIRRVPGTEPLPS